MVGDISQASCEPTLGWPVWISAVTISMITDWLTLALLYWSTPDSLVWMSATIKPETVVCVSWQHVSRLTTRPSLTSTSGGTSLGHLPVTHFESCWNRVGYTLTTRMSTPTLSTTSPTYLTHDTTPTDNLLNTPNTTHPIHSWHEKLKICGQNFVSNWADFLIFFTIPSSTSK
jgi:hypothetical protein